MILKVKANREAQWFYLRYERLQNLCYACGIMGHGFDDCDKVEIGENNNLPYEDWIHANSLAALPEYKQVLINDGVPPRQM